MFEATRRTSGREPLRGRILARRYRLERILGEGGMGTVYRAIDLELDALVAIKFLKDRHLHPRSIRRFVREGKTGGKLCHPNIVKILDAGEQDGPFLVMEYVDGSDIRRWWKSSRQGLDALLGRFDEALQALEYAHSRGVIHRDIKPENVFVNGDGRVKVMDFGLAQDLSSNRSSLTSTGAILGTAAYMSPEQAGAHATDGRTDLYSLGVVMYELLTGRLPFRGNPISVLMAHVKRAPAPLRSLNPQVDEHLESLIMCLLEKELPRRFQSARATLEALAEVRAYLAPGASFTSAEIPAFLREAAENSAAAVPKRSHAIFDEGGSHSSGDGTPARGARDSDGVKLREMALVSFEASGFSECLGELSPLDALRLLEDYRTRIRSRCESSGATLVEFHGTMATAIYDQENQPQPGAVAIQTVLDLADDVREWLASLSIKGLKRTSIGAGVFLEPVAAGTSIESSRETSLLPTTEACRRLMRLAGASSAILANDRAALQVDGAVVVTPFKDICIAGRKREVRVFRVQQKSGDAVDN